MQRSFKYNKKSHNISRHKVALTEKSTTCKKSISLSEAASNPNVKIYFRFINQSKVIHEHKFLSEVRWCINIKGETNAFIMKETPFLARFAQEHTSVFAMAVWGVLYCMKTNHNKSTNDGK